MLYDYIVNNYDKDEPIFLSELPGNSRDYVRQEMKQLADEGKVERLYNGVYYLSYMTILGTKGRVSVDKLVEIEKRINEKRFLHCHQSYLVNMDYVGDVQDDFVMKDGTIVPIRVRGRKDMLDVYYNYFVNHFMDQ